MESAVLKKKKMKLRANSQKKETLVRKKAKVAVSIAAYEMKKTEKKRY